MRTTDDHVLHNRRYWNAQAAEYAAPGRRNWARQPSWGVWGIPEADLGLLAEVEGRDVVELGCGTAYMSSWVRRLGGRPVGLDNSAAQLATARTLQRENHLHFPLLHADAENVPLRDGSFDLAISEYGASIWCDPHRWIPEAARLLRPGGRLTFLVNSVLYMLTVPDEENLPPTSILLRDYFGMHRFEWPDEDGIEFHLNHGDMVRLLRQQGFEVLDLIELQAPQGATTRFPYMSPDWARRWPSEEIWVARRRV